MSSTNGLDPELLILDGDGYCIPASKFLSHSSDVSLSGTVYDVTSENGHFVHDNASMELRIHPNVCLETINHSMSTTLWHAYRAFRLGKIRNQIPMDSNISFAPAGRLRPEDRQLESVAVFGCSPSIGITSDMEPVTTVPLASAGDTAWRSAGFHVHVGTHNYDEIAEYDPEALPSVFANHTAILDAFVGIVDVLMCHHGAHANLSRIRRSRLGYGCAGEHRVTFYTEEDERWDDDLDDYRDDTVYKSLYEYRVLSPWPLSHPMWTWWAGSAVRHVIDRMSSATASEIVQLLPDRSEIIDIINSTDVDGAWELWPKIVEAVGGGVDTLHRCYHGTDSLHTHNIDKLNVCLSNRGYRTLLNHVTPTWQSAWFRSNAGWLKQSGEFIGPYHRKIRTRRLHLRRQLNVASDALLPPIHSKAELDQLKSTDSHYLAPYHEEHNRMGYTTLNKYSTSGRYTYFPSGYEHMVEDCAIEAQDDV